MYPSENQTKTLTKPNQPWFETWPLSLFSPRFLGFPSTNSFVWVLYYIMCCSRQNGRTETSWSSCSSRKFRKCPLSQAKSACRSVKPWVTWSRSIKIADAVKSQPCDPFPLIRRCRRSPYLRRTHFTALNVGQYYYIPCRWLWSCSAILSCI